MTSIRRIFRRGRIEADLAEEIRGHLEEKVDELVASGLPREQAIGQARREFGNVTLIEEQAREVWKWLWIEHLLTDVHFALRRLRKSPAFALAAILTFALGIGANTAIFSIVYGVLLRPLPYRTPSSLTLIGAEATFAGQRRPANFAGQELRSWKEQTHSFEEIAGWGRDSVGLESERGVEPVAVACVSSPFFSLVGEPMALGRSIGTGEDHSAVAVISSRLWHQSFGGDPHVVGRAIVLRGRTFTVIGVARSDFRLPDARIDVWVPLEEAKASGFVPWLDGARGYGLLMIGRLKRGVSLAEARAEVGTVGRAIGAAIPGRGGTRTVTLTRLGDAIAGPVRPALLLLLAAVGLVLLVACANVTQLLLARQSSRARELAVRVALGASRGRLVIEAMTETALVSAAGAAGGVLLAEGVVRAIVWLKPSQLPRLDAIRVDAPILLFTGLAAMASALVAGLGPALRASRDKSPVLLHSTARASGGPSVRRLRSSLVIGELAVSIVLLVGGTLLARSLVRLLNTDVGARTDHAAAALIAFSRQFPRAAAPETADALVARVRALPGVERAALGAALPPAGERARYTLTGIPSTRGVLKEYEVNAVPVTPDFFRTLGIPLLRGRFFSDADAAGRPPVMIMGADTAALLFGDHPLGHTLRLPVVGGGHATPTLVGVVGDVKYKGLDQPAAGAIYLPFAQQPWSEAFLVARTSGDASVVALGIERAVSGVDRRIAVYWAKSLDEVVSEQVAQPRFRAVALLAIAGLAVVLAAVGLYGVIAYSVSQRTAEFGIRIALGATAADLTSMILRDGGRLAAAGTGLGLTAAYALTRMLAALLYGVSATDAASFASAAAFVLAIAAVATFVPARRATRVDPLIALRSE